MRIIIGAVMAAASVGAPALSQEDPMAMQRCVWSCLSNFGPATNPAYHQCVERQCSAVGEPSASAAPQTDPTAAWQVGRAGDGTPYAGVDGVAGQTGLYLFCRGGRGRLRVVGIDGGERRMIVEIDGAAREMAFERSAEGDFPEAAIQPDDPLIAALQSGSRVKVLSFELGPVVDATLRGSRRALAEVVAAC